MHSDTSLTARLAELALNAAACGGTGAGADTHEHMHMHVHAVPNEHAPVLCALHAHFPFGPDPQVRR